MNGAPQAPTRPSTDRSTRRRPARRVAWTGALTVVAALALAGCSAGTATPSAAAPTPHARRAGNGVRGTVQAENGSTWTVAARNGKQYTVTVSASTQYGTKAAPATAAQFPVGAQVTVTGPVSGTTVTATRIAAPRAPRAGTSPTTAPTPA